MPDPSYLGPHRSTGLVDVLDRILEKGLVIAGDVKVSLAEVELLTIRIRLIVCSIDKARSIGLDWWKNDRYFGSGTGGDGTRLVVAPAAASRVVTQRSRAARPGRTRRRTDGRRRARGGE